jgi:hypothetical protein
LLQTQGIKIDPPQFNLGNPNNMPMIIFGNRMPGRDTVHLRGLSSGTTGTVYRQLKTREKRGELVLLDVNEDYTSQVCSMCGARNPRHRLTPSDQSIWGFNWKWLRS